MFSHHLPKTRLGKTAAGLGFALVGSIFVSLFFAAAIGGDAALIEGSSLLKALAGVLSVVFTLSAPLSLLLAAADVVKNRDWSAVRLLAVLFAATIALFLIGEFAFPH